MSRILFYLLIKPLSFFPLSILYRLSDLLFVVLFYVLGFRKKVVFTNMRNSFPDRSPEEIRKLAIQFYRHFADVFVESIRMFSMPKAEAMRRMKLTNPEVLDRFYDEGRSIFITAGHYNNWEFAAIVLNAQCKHQAVGVYAPLSNPFFNRKFQESRRRFGLVLVPKQETTRYFSNSKNELIAVVMGTDQSPTFSNQVHWTTFLNQDTAVMVGTERYSQRYNYPVVFGKIKKIKRGYYEMTFSIVEEQPSKTPKGEITEKHTRLLEEEILEAPQYWLWTHKRWKRKR